MKKYTPSTPKPPAPAPTYARASRLTKRRIFDARFLALATSLACLPAAHGAIITADDPKIYDYFGWSVGISGNTVVVGAPVASGEIDGDEEITSLRPGTTYVYTGLNSETQTETLLTGTFPPSLLRTVENRFGQSVSIFGNSIIIGAPWEVWGMGVVETTTTGTGVAYIYMDASLANPIILTSPLQTASITAYEKMDSFGASVGISNNIAIVGAPRTILNSSYTDTGAVYIYHDLNLSNQATIENSVIKLTNPDPAEHQYFGESVGISGDSVIIGLGGTIITHTQSGESYSYGTYSQKAYIYKNLASGTQGGIENSVIKLTARTVTADDAFSTSVSISDNGNTAIIGAPGTKNNTGAAYVYKGLNSVSSGTDEMTETAKLTASDMAEGDSFGSSVSISGNTAIVGAPGKNDSPGVVYLYTGLDSESLTGTIKETVKLTASDAGMYSQFGFSVKMEDGTDNFIVGAPFAARDTIGGAGKAYTGRTSTFTTVNTENITRATEGLSFVSQTDWIIGENTSNNKVTLSKIYSSSNDNAVDITYDSENNITGAIVTQKWYPDKANVTSTDKGVYIGRFNGANNNTLVVEGELTTNAIYIGNGKGANNNTLRVSANNDKDNVGGKITAKNIEIGSKFSQGNGLILEMGGDELTLTFPQPPEAATTILLHKGNYLAIWGTQPDNTPDNPADNYPLAPEKVVEALELANVYLKAGWIPQGEENDITSALAAEFTSTSLNTELPGYTILHAKTGGTPEPSTYALFGSVLLAGLMLIHRRRKRAKPPQK
jgi:hypothetical protein